MNKVPFYMIDIPLNKNGNGPCDLDEFDHKVYEVWDYNCITLYTSKSKFLTKVVYIWMGLLYHLNIK